MKTTITLDAEVEQPFEVKSRPLGLRPGLDPARLSELDDDLEAEEFLRKTARLNEREG